MVPIHLTRTAGNPGLHTGWRTAAPCAEGTSKGKREGKTITVGKLGNLPYEVMVWAKYMSNMIEEAKGLSSLTLIWDDTCFITHYDPKVDEWRLGEESWRHAERLTSMQSPGSPAQGFVLLFCWQLSSENVRSAWSAMSLPICKTTTESYGFANSASIHFLLSAKMTQSRQTSIITEMEVEIEVCSVSQ